MESPHKFFFLWRSYKTTMEMLKDRNYIVPEENVITFEKFLQWVGDDDESNVRENLTEIFEKNNGDKCTTIWYSNPDVGNAAIQIIENKIKSLEVNKAILIVYGKITTYAASAIRLLKFKKINIDVFYEKELQSNPTHHVDVPRHIICSTDTKNKILNDFAIRKEQLPQIKTTDPICRYIGGIKDQLIKIVRPSDTMSEVVIKNKKRILYDISYRLVV